MTPHHHPSDELLVAYAAGNLGEAPSLVIATHLALCPDCRAEVRRLEAVGGALLDDLPVAPLDDDLLSAIFARLDEGDGDRGGDGHQAGDTATLTRPAPAPAVRNGRRPSLPEPLRGYIGGDLDAIRWTRLMRGVEEAEVPVGNQGAKGRLLRIKGGLAMPRHTHAGMELTLVLTGGFTDETGHYGRGDFAATDGTVDHKPVADAGEDCICLAITDAPLRLTGTFGRLLNPFIRF
ncbi:MAG: transcriptional activator ChrR [Pseudomonadota bacterium]|jgi:putative transcriptional regulator